jgi:hypothetical protein
MADKPSAFECPSAQPDMAGARVFGVLSGTDEEPRIAYLKPGVRVSQSMLAKLGAVEPTQVFRFAAACEEHRCTHFDGSRCQLGARIARDLGPVVDALPPCQIRVSCRWFAEQGGAVCLRCPQIITRVSGDDALRRIATTPERPPTVEPDPAG